VAATLAGVLVVGWVGKAQAHLPELADTLAADSDLTVVAIAGGFTLPPDDNPL
jgi:hypothetical protein